MISSRGSLFSAVLSPMDPNTAPENNLDLKWRQVLPPGAGLERRGNSSSVRVVLQCLTHIAPLANYMLSEEHSRTCQQSGVCMMCVLGKHTISAFKHSGQIIQPVGVTSLLSRLFPDFKPGLPESSIGFYKAVVEALHQSDLNGRKRNGQTTEDSLVKQIFEGTVQHALTCPACGELHLVFTPFRELIVGTEAPGNVTRDLTWYMMVEQLGFTLQFNCRRCKRSGHSHYKTTFLHLPNVLVINAKPRDEEVTAKTVKPMRYPEDLDMRPFMSQPSAKTEMYQLYGVTVLENYKKDRSHSYCYVKGSDEQWYIMDDDKVSLSNRRSALEQKASLLFYVRSS
ncbi:ubiquitin carboxyl-terminal hydrolase 36 [Astyanax mexicanus]|uniref:ubiquitin carboxyl-terminal hydrolase 36 n=1 Tax=Astyanax mexicanus TaxID=7994 RepID=UPI0020CACF08|nr:ubiquitin carboxyl-terminal hydrolase 36 [Astyanax mexicanus]